MESVKSLEEAIEKNEGPRANPVGILRMGWKTTKLSSFISPISIEVYWDLYAWLGGLSNGRKMSAWDVDIEVDATEKGQIKRWLRECRRVLNTFQIYRPHAKIRKVPGRPDGYVSDYAWVDHLKARDKEWVASFCAMLQLLSGTDCPVT